MAKHKKSQEKAPFDPTKPLENRRWELFVHNLLLDPEQNQGKAYEDAGYKARGNAADVCASQLLKNPKVSARYEYLKQQIAEECKIDSAYIIKGLKDVFERCMQHEAVLDREGNPTGEYRFDSAGANAALDKLAKINGDYKKDNAQKSQGGSGDITINVMSPADLKAKSDKELMKIAGYTPK